MATQPAHLGPQQLGNPVKDDNFCFAIFANNFLDFCLQQADQNVITILRICNVNNVIFVLTSLPSSSPPIQQTSKICLFETTSQHVTGIKYITTSVLQKIGGYSGTSYKSKVFIGPKYTRVPIYRSVTNTRSASCGPNLQRMHVAPLGGQNLNHCQRHNGPRNRLRDLELSH